MTPTLSDPRPPIVQSDSLGVGVQWSENSNVDDFSKNLIRPAARGVLVRERAIPAGCGVSAETRELLESHVGQLVIVHLPGEPIDGPDGELVGMTASRAVAATLAPRTPAST